MKLTSMTLIPALSPLTAEPNNNDICAMERWIVCEATRNDMRSPAVSSLADIRAPPA